MGLIRKALMKSEQEILFVNDRVKESEISFRVLEGLDSKLSLIMKGMQNQYVWMYTESRSALLQSSFLDLGRGANLAFPFIYTFTHIILASLIPLA